MRKLTAVLAVVPVLFSTIAVPCGGSGARSKEATVRALASVVELDEKDRLLQELYSVPFCEGGFVAAVLSDTVNSRYYIGITAEGQTYRLNEGVDPVLVSISMFSEAICPASQVTDLAQDIALMVSMGMRMPMAARDRPIRTRLQNFLVAAVRGDTGTTSLVADPLMVYRWSWIEATEHAQELIQCGIVLGPECLLPEPRLWEKGVIQGMCSDERISVEDGSIVTRTVSCWDFYFQDDRVVKGVLRFRQHLISQAFDYPAKLRYRCDSEDHELGKGKGVSP